MNLAQESNLPYSPEEYFTITGDSESSLEYEHGKIIAKVPTSEPHNDLVFNLTSQLKQATRNKGCKAHFETIRLEVEENGLYYLPDVMLTCDERDHEDLNTKRFPILVIEVLSPTSETRDRGKKFHAYLRLPSLQHYLLVAQNQTQVEVFSKTENGGWIYQRFDQLEEVITLSHINISLPLTQIYEGVTLAE